MSESDNHDREDSADELYFDAAKLFKHLRADNRVEPTESVLDWSFFFESRAVISDENIGSLIEMLGDEVNADEDALRAEVHIEGDEVTDLEDLGTTELILIFAGVMQQHQLESLHKKFDNMTDKIGIQYSGVTCMEESGQPGMADIVKWVDGVLATTAKWDITDLATVAPTMRTWHLNQLNDLGLEAANWMPNAQQRGHKLLRPKSEIVRRLMATYAAIAWVCAPEEDVSTESVTRYVKENGLTHDSFSKRETQWIQTARDEVRQFGPQAGWLTENMWSLAWLLGYPPTPNPCPQQVSQEIIEPLRNEFLGRFESSFDELMTATRIRQVELVITLEDLMYCAHHAMQTIGNVESTGIVQERRHSLTWALSPGVHWDQTDLST